LVLCLLPALAWSDEIFTEDVVIQNTDPALVFDDTDASSFEYVIRGRDEFFSIRDDSTSRTHLYIDTAQQSFALGVNAQVSAGNGAALGRNSIVSAESAVALGMTATASAEQSIAIGSGTTAGAGRSIALGTGAESTGNKAIAAGDLASASGGNSIAMGTNAQSSLTASIAIGSTTVASADFSTAIGYQANAIAQQASAFGFVTKAHAARSVAVGHRAFADQPDTLILGATKGVNGAGAYTNAGFGTTNPVQAVDVERSGEAARFQLTSFTDTASEAPQYIQRRARGTSGAPTAVLNSDNLGLFSFRGYNGTTMGGSRATITAQAAGNFTVSSTPTRLIFATTPVGQTTPQQVLVITPDGKVQVNGQNLNVPDYVFEDDYALMPLEELRSFIDENGHLPGIPSADQVNAEGHDLAGSDMAHLRKIEELTLYTLQQQEQLRAQASQLEAQRTRIAELEDLRERVARLESQ
jgi:hypothetical protein